MKDEHATYSIAVSGKTYFAALDPLATGAHDEGLTSTGSRRVGKGRQFLYELDRPHLDALIKRLDAVGTTFLDCDTPDTRAEGRACLADRDKLRRLVTP